MERIKLFVTAVLGVALLAGCGGGGGSLNKGSSAPKIYVDDTANGRVVRFDEMTGAHWQAKYNDGDKPPQPFGTISLDMAKDSQGRLYILDEENNRLLRFNSFGAGAGASYGSSGSGVGQFDHPGKIAIDAQDRIYILDTDNARVVRIDDMSGANWVSFGSSGSGVNQFNIPYGLALDSQGRIYIADTFNHRIVRIDDMAGTNWTTLDLSGSTSIVDIVITPDSRMLMADRNEGVILTDLMSLSGFQGFVQDSAQAVAMDSQGRIYVVNQDDYVLRRYDSMTDPSPVTFGTAGSGDGQFESPTNILIAP